ncbi:MAG: hypothetical protein DRP97_03600 [Candidatus Latescibacterota bacterium]|nr:MAG: hypothetical protein DRP97_03600 [Candidatus Latescibacterota bacterium]
MTTVYDIYTLQAENAELHAALEKCRAGRIKGGKTKTPRRAKTSRKNGKRGGKPFGGSPECVGCGRRFTRPQLERATKIGNGVLCEKCAAERASARKAIVDTGEKDD